MLDIYKILFCELSDHDIPICSWKNNHSIGSALSGDGDLDLLVPFHALNRFENVVDAAGFRRVYSYVGDFPYVRHYYACDARSMEFAHIHVYFKLITGDSQLKNHRFPVEEKLFESSVVNAYGIEEPHPRHQVELFEFRKRIKRLSIVGRTLWYKEREDYDREYKYIRSRCVDEFEYSSSPPPLFAVPTRPIYGSTVITSLFVAFIMRSMVRRNPWRSRFEQLSKRALNKLVNRRKKLVQGSVIALVGLDGSGKSTAVSMVEEWLSSEFSVRRFHFGRPPATILTKPLHVLLTLRRIFFRRRRGNKTASVEGHVFQSLVFKLRYLILAIERQRLWQMRDGC